MTTELEAGAPVRRWAVDDCSEPSAPGSSCRRRCRYSLPLRRCALDIASENPDGMTLEAIGAVLRSPPFTRERVRQLEQSALARLARAAKRRARAAE